MKNIFKHKHKFMLENTHETGAEHYECKCGECFHRISKLEREKLGMDDNFDCGWRRKDNQYKPERQR